MIFLWIVIGLIVLIGIIAAVTSLNQSPHTDNNDNIKHEGGCCGMHMTCEKDSLLSAVSPNIEYYDDEELDAYIGKKSNEYTDREIDNFRDILETLKDDDVAGWVRSMQNRKINIPEEILPDIYLIVGENRLFRSQN